MFVFDILKKLFFGFVDILMHVKIFGTNLWFITLGFLVFSFAVKAIQILFFSGGGGKD